MTNKVKEEVHRIQNIENFILEAEQELIEKKNVTKTQNLIGT